MTTQTDHTISTKFSIFDPVITYEHREFYERIISELNGIFPICNQGKCTAVEISESATEQEQITDLKEAGGRFSRELLDVSKRLFDQFYQAKEDFCKAIYSNTAYININLMDRNLLERTCDVRWWALESAFSSCIAACDSLDEDLSKVIEALTKWADKAKAPNAVKRGLELASGGAGQFASFAVNAEAIAVFRELADSSEVATYGSDLAEQLKAIITSIGSFHKSSVFACDRLEDINSSYTLYRDLVITNKIGCVIGNANREQRERVLGINISQEHWFTKALETHDGTEYHAQDLASSVVESDQSSLIYSTAIRTNGETNGDIIGAMGVYFDFQGEVNLILNDYLPQDDRGNPDDGWYSFLTNEQGMVIGSSDIAMVPVMNYAHIPRRHRSLEQGERIHSYGGI